MIDDNVDDLYLTVWLLGSSAMIYTNIKSWHAYCIKYTHNYDNENIKVCPDMRISAEQDTMEMQDGHCYELQKEIIYPFLVQTLSVCRTNYRPTFPSMPVGNRKITKKIQKN